MLSNYQLALDLRASDLYAYSKDDKTACPAALLVQPNLLSSVSWTQERDCIPQASSWQATWPSSDKDRCATVQLPPHVLGRKKVTWTLTLSPFLGWHDQGQVGATLRGCVLRMAKPLAAGLAKDLWGRATYPPPVFALVFHRREKQTYYFLRKFISIL